MRERDFIMKPTMLIDFDDTLVDFIDAEIQAFYTIAQDYLNEATESDLQTFMQVNQAHWEAFQRGELNKEEVLNQRFRNFFARYDIEVDGPKVDHEYRTSLSKATVKYMPHVLTTLDILKNHYDLYIVTNGVRITQLRRLKQTPFETIFKGIFISEDTGSQKPMPEFFDYVFNHIGNERRQDAIIVGDSLTSDIQGGINAGIRTCWYNGRDKVNDSGIQPDYTIHSFEQLVHLM